MLKGIRTKILGKKPAIVVMFVKYPEPGKVKTRLAGTIGKKKAAAIYKAMTEDLVSNLKDNKGYDFAICYSPQNKKRELQKWLKIRKMLPQSKGDLGTRMKTRFTAYLRHYKKVMIIGSDCPTIFDEDLKKAFAELRKKDIILGKADDGGYYLVGMKNLQGIFDNIAWSTTTVLKQTLEKIKLRKLSYSILKEKTDIDTKTDLRKLKRDKNLLKLINTKKELSKIKT